MLRSHKRVLDNILVGRTETQTRGQPSETHSWGNAVFQRTYTHTHTKQASIALNTITLHNKTNSKNMSTMRSDSMRWDSMRWDSLQWTRYNFVQWNYSISDLSSWTTELVLKMVWNVNKNLSFSIFRHLHCPKTSKWTNLPKIYSNYYLVICSHPHVFWTTV